MKLSHLPLCLLSLALPALAAAQSAPTPALPEAPTAVQTASEPAPAPLAAKSRKHKKELVPMKPLSRLAFSGGVSALGVNLEAATNISRHLNARVVGNIFQYSTSNFMVSNVNVNAGLDFATMGAMLDYYPFPRHGFRISPGLAFYNQNRFSAIGTTTSSALELGDHKYYPIDPIQFNANVGLNRRETAFTLTTGWGNMIPRKGGHWSFPFEIGVVFTGSPVIDLNVYGGAGCIDTPTCKKGDSAYISDISTNADVKANIQTEIDKYRNNLNNLSVYPVISFGVAYSFRIR